MPSLERAVKSWGWLLGSLGWVQYQDWPAGRSWRDGDVYVVVEQSRALSDPVHYRMRAGLNHLAFHAGARDTVNAMAAAAPLHGWALMFADKHPWAGGPEHYAAYLENEDGFEAELVAT